MTKPIVHYDATFPVKLVVLPHGGTAAFVKPVDHPDPTSGAVSNKKMVLTSDLVVMPNEAGQFETQNTVYRPQSVSH